MSKETREHISCLMDGEISREASRFLVRRLGADEELSATWARYHVVRDCLRDQEGGFAREDLCTRIRLAIDEEEKPAAVRRPRARGWLKPVAGMAIAASVALVAVMAVDPGAAPGVQPPGAATESVAAEPFSSPQGISTSTVASRTVSSQKMNAYLLRHYQATGAGNGRNFVGFVPVIVNAAPSAESEPSDTADESAGGENAPAQRPE